MADAPPDAGPRKTRGRPRVDESGRVISTWVRVSEYDRLNRLANRQNKSVGEVVRDLLHLRLR